MKESSWIAAAAVVVIANAFALTHAMRNRQGEPDAELTLTQNELQYLWPSSSGDDSGVALRLVWTSPLWNAPHSNWLDASALRELGFDCSRNPAGAEGERFYTRQRPRRAFVALARAGSGALYGPPGLTAIDAGLDARELRRRHPDRSSVLILPAVIGIYVLHDANQTARIEGSIEELPSSIHVPRPFSDEFRRRAGKPAPYRVHLRYGAWHEPSVTGVEFGR